MDDDDEGREGEGMKNDGEVLAKSPGIKWQQILLALWNGMEGDRRKKYPPAAE
jgi:hypothetical protein